MVQRVVAQLAVTGLVVMAFQHDWLFLALFDAMVWAFAESVCIAHSMEFKVTFPNSFLELLRFLDGFQFIWATTLGTLFLFGLPVTVSAPYSSSPW